MKPEKQRIAIAEACGWVIRDAHLGLGYPPGSRIYKGNHCRNSEEIPDYLNSLDAMHEAELTLSFSQYEKFTKHLLGGVKPGSVVHWSIVSASAAQRAESFLRAIGKWEVEAL